MSFSWPRHQSFQYGVQMIELEQEEIGRVSGAGLTGTVAGTAAGIAAGQALGPEVGAGVGAAIGSVVPGVGTVGGALIGAGAGAIYGAALGGAAGGYIVDKLQDHGWAYFFPNRMPRFEDLWEFTSWL
jgi:hypothetical protein